MLKPAPFQHCQISTIKLQKNLINLRFGCLEAFDILPTVLRVHPTLCMIILYNFIYVI